MLKTTLVKEDLDAGRALLDALKEKGVPVWGAMWLYEPEHKEWEFHIASPDVTVRGPLAVYEEVRLLLKELGEDFPIQFDNVVVNNTTNSFVEGVASQLKVEKEPMRLWDSYFQVGRVEDGYAYKVDRTTPARPPLPKKGKGLRADRASAAA